MSALLKSWLFLSLLHHLDGTFGGRPEEEGDEKKTVSDGYTYRTYGLTSIVIGTSTFSGTTTFG